jgi:hypothetical protein
MKSLYKGFVILTATGHLRNYWVTYCSTASYCWTFAYICQCWFRKENSLWLCIVANGKQRFVVLVANRGIATRCRQWNDSKRNDASLQYVPKSSSQSTTCLRHFRRRSRNDLLGKSFSGDFPETSLEFAPSSPWSDCNWGAVVCNSQRLYDG